MVSSPDATCAARSMPSEVLFATICAALSSKLISSACSPRAQAAATKLTPRLVFDVPGAPEIKVLLPWR